MYGHNRVGVLHTLARIKAGAELIVTTDNNHTFTYIFRGAYETSPSDDSLFAYRGKPILTLQTCSGVFFQNRQMFVFDLEKAQ
jgi:sortase (surface protein transpeptidase)